MSRSPRLAFALEHLRFNRNDLATLRVAHGLHPTNGLASASTRLLYRKVARLGTPGRRPEETRAGGEGAQATTGAEEITTGTEGERQSHHAPASFKRDDVSSS